MLFEAEERESDGSTSKISKMVCVQTKTCGQTVSYLKWPKTEIAINIAVDYSSIGQ